MTVALMLGLLFGCMAGGLVYLWLPVPRDRGESGGVSVEMVIIAIVVVAVATVAVLVILSDLTWAPRGALR